MSDMKEIIQAVAKKQFNAANEMISQKLSDKISDALITKKETVGREFAAGVNEEKRDYKTFFNAAMKKFNISSPADLKSEKERKEFFNYVDKNFKGSEEEMYGSEEELMGALQGLLGGSKKKQDLRKFQTPGQQDIEQGKMSSPFQLKGFKGKGQTIFTDPAGPVAQNPVEQPGDADPYKSGSAEVRDPIPKGNPMTVGDIDVESDRKRGEFGLGTGAIPAQRKIAGSMTTTDLDRSRKDYDLEDEEELGAEAIGSPEARAKRPVEDDPVFKVAKRLKGKDGLETDDPFRTFRNTSGVTSDKLKKARRA